MNDKYTDNTQSNDRLLRYEEEQTDEQAYYEAKKDIPPEIYEETE